MGPNPILRRKHLPKSKWSSFGKSSRNKREARSLGGRPKQISGRSWGSPNWALTQWGAWLGSWSWSISERVKGPVTGADAILLEQCLVSPPDLLHVANVCPSREKTGQPRHRWVPVKQWFFVVWELFQRLPEELNIFQFSKPKKRNFSPVFRVFRNWWFGLSFRNGFRNTFWPVILKLEPGPKTKTKTTDLTIKWSLTALPWHHFQTRQAPLHAAAAGSGQAGLVPGSVLKT